MNPMIAMSCYKFVIGKQQHLINLLSEQDAFKNVQENPKI